MKNRKLTYEEIFEIRKFLVKELINIKNNEYIKLDLGEGVLEQIIFNINEDDRKVFVFDNTLMSKLDLTEISFDNVDVRGYDFTGTHGVKINPQTVWNRNFENTRLNGVEIIGPFDDCFIQTTDFTGSRGVVINPQTVWDKDFELTKLNDVEIIGSFDDCFIQRTDFTGSKGAKINPSKLRLIDERGFYRRVLRNTKLKDTEIIGSFDRCVIEGTSFTGSKGAVINPQTVWDKNFRNTVLTDAKIIAPFNGCNMEGTITDGADLSSLDYTNELKDKIKSSIRTRIRG